MTGHELDSSACQGRDIDDDYLTCEKKDLFMNLWMKRKKVLTYIVGAKCIDGIVIIGDKRITIDNGTDITYQNKIFQPYTDLVMGAAGTTGLFTSFHDRLLNKIENTDPRPDIKSAENAGIYLKVITEGIIHDMIKAYSAHVMADEFELLMAYRVSNTPKLFHFNGYGLSEPVSAYRAIGHGEPYGSILIKTILGGSDNILTMKEFAKLGCIIIKYIQDFDLDKSVGTDPKGFHKLPQVWFMPDADFSNFDSKLLPVGGSWVREAHDHEIKEFLEGTDKYISKIKNAIKDIKFFSDVK